MDRTGDRPHARRARRAAAAATVSLLAVMFAATPAVAGGSWFETTKEQYEPGDTVTIVGHTTGGQLGWIEDGPFYGYLRVTPPGPDVAGWPVVAPTDLPLGPLQLDRTGRNGWRLRATISFELPRDLAPGAYDFVYCNDPCTTGLGDLIGGTVYVGIAPPHAASEPATSTTARTSTTVPESVASREPPSDTAAEERGSSQPGADRASWAVGGLVLAALTAGVALALRRGRGAA
jgi:hypothetical protein